MILATHGRAIWILDHLEPIQEYAAAQAADADAKLFTPPPCPMYRRPARDRNYEFWGDQTFFGENPPAGCGALVASRSQVERCKLKITDAAGREVREISGPGARQQQEAPACRRRAGICGCSRCRRSVGRGGRPAGGRPRRRPAAPGQAQPGDAGPAGPGSGPGEPVRRRLRRRRRRLRRRRRIRRRRGDGRAVRAARHLQRRAHRRRQDGRYEAAAGRPPMPRWRFPTVERKKHVRHGDGDARPPEARHRVQTASGRSTRRMTELAKEIGRPQRRARRREGQPFEAFNKDVTALAPKFAPPAFGRGGGAGPACGAHGGSSGGPAWTSGRSGSPSSCDPDGQPVDPDWSGQERPHGDHAGK